MTTAVQLAQQVAPGVSLGFKNRIINGAMMIDQRNAGASVTGNAGVYPLDRWKISASQSSKLTAQQNAGSVTPPVGFTNYLGITSSSAYSVGSGDYFALMQIIEGYNIADLAWGTANAKAVTLSFQVYSSLTGTFGGSITNASEARSYPFTYTISSANTWTSVSVTIPGDTTGTWLTNSSGGIKIFIGLGVGTTLSGTAGAWSNNTYYQSATGAVSVVGTNGATFYITGVQLEVGTTATPFEFRDYGRELIMCQRYFEKVNVGVNSAFTIVSNQFGSGSGLQIYYKVEKRATPSLSSSGNTGGWYRYNVYNGTNGACTIGLVSYSTAYAYLNPSVSGANQVYWVYGANSSSDPYYLLSSAEL